VVPGEFAEFLPQPPERDALELFTSRDSATAGERRRTGGRVVVAVELANSHPKSWQTTRMTSSRWTAAYAGSLYFVTKTK
jgi:hypothetical protein